MFLGCEHHPDMCFRPCSPGFRVAIFDGWGKYSLVCVPSVTGGLPTGPNSEPQAKLVACMFLRQSRCTDEVRSACLSGRVPAQSGAHT